MSEATAYVLGSDDAEIARLDAQASSSRAPRRRCCARRDRRPDAGAGPGDWPWPRGLPGGRPARPRRSVLGVDQPERLLEIAESRRAARRRERRVPAGGCADFSASEPFDAIVARLLLFHLPDREEVLRASSTRCARAAPWSSSNRHRRHARRAGGPARRVGARLDRGGVQVGGRGPADRRAGRAPAAPCGLRGRLDLRDPVLLRPERSDRAAPVRRRCALAGAADRGAGIADEAELGLETLQLRIAEQVAAATR